MCTIPIYLTSSVPAERYKDATSGHGQDVPDPYTPSGNPGTTTLATPHRRSKVSTLSSTRTSRHSSSSRISPERKVDRVKKVRWNRKIPPYSLYRKYVIIFIFIIRIFFAIDIPFVDVIIHIPVLKSRNNFG